MDQINLNSYSKISNFNVSRETCNELESFISLIQQKNEEINIISKKNSKKDDIRQRHVIDSAQIVDFVDINSNTTYDLGSGAGLPGIVVAIVMKNLKVDMKISLFEKSYHKCVFLKHVSKELDLNTEVIQKDIFKLKNMETGTIMSRAFKPMPLVLNLVYENFNKYKNLIFFMGKSGKKIFENSKKNWELEYIEKKSLTSEDSFLINIKKIKKKN